MKREMCLRGREKAEGDDVHDDDDADEWRSAAAVLWQQTAAHTSPALAALIKSFRRTKMVTMAPVINN